MFEGPWTISEAEGMEGTHIGRGEIIKHKSGAIVLRCPKCNAIQFTHSPVVGNDETPTLTKRIQCGSGFCKRCAIWFSVDAGKTVIHQGKEEATETPIPERLVKAGVKTAPTIEKE